MCPESQCNNKECGQRLYSPTLKGLILEEEKHHKNSVEKTPPYWHLCKLFKVYDEDGVTLIEAHLFSHGRLRYIEPI